MGTYRRRDRHNEWWVEFVYRGRRVRRRSPVQHGRGATAYERTLRHELEQAAASGVALGVARPPRFEEYATRWMRDYVQPQNRHAGIREKEIILRIHLLPRFASFRLDDITTPEIDRVIGELQRSGLSPKTTNNILTVLRRALTVATEWGLLRAVPRIRLLRVPEAAFRFLSETESRALLAATPDGFWRTFVLFVLHTGVRFSEAAVLEWENVHLEAEHPFVHICRGGSRGIPGPTKSGRTRDIPLSPSVVAALRSFPREHRYVFPQAKGREMMNSASESKYLYKFCDAANIKRCGWHTLRHTFGTNMAARGVLVPVLQKLMGHSSIKTTMRYVHVDRASVLAAVSAIEFALPVPWALPAVAPQFPHPSSERALAAA